MLIEQEDLPKLQEAFKANYGRDIVGNQMGQFHRDFNPVSKTSNETPVSKHAIFVGKKFYVDHLV
jgi:hypothetical protein